MKHTFKDWFLLTRPWGYGISILPALLAIAYVFYQNSLVSMHVNWLFGIIVLITAPIIHASGNVMSDYFDYKNQVDRPDDMLGINRMLIEKKFEPKEAYRFSIALLFISIIIGLFLAFNSSLHLLWIGGLGVLGLYFYYVLKYRALGDFNVFIIFGLFIPLGTYVVMTNRLSWEMLLVSAGAGLLIINILHANNTRDMKTDRKVNIRTVAMNLGLAKSKKYYIALGYGAYILILLSVLIGILHPISLIVLLSLPLQLKANKKIRSVTDETLDELLTLDQETAKLLTIYLILLISSIFVGGLIHIM